MASIGHDADASVQAQESVKTYSTCKRKNTKNEERFPRAMWGSQNRTFTVARTTNPGESQQTIDVKNRGKNMA